MLKFQDSNPSPSTPPASLTPSLGHPFGIILGLLQDILKRKKRGKGARREWGYEEKATRRKNEKQEGLLGCSYFHICILRQVHTYTIHASFGLPVSKMISKGGSQEGVKEEGGVLGNGFDS